MALAAEKEFAHIGETSGCADHDHDLIHELSRRLDAVWRFDQYIANAAGRDNLIRFWTNMKQQETENIIDLKELVAGEVHNGCF